MQKYITKNDSVLEYFEFIHAYVFIGYLNGLTLAEFVADYEANCN